MAGVETTRPLRGADPVELLNRRIHQLSGQLADVHGELAAVRKRGELYATFDKSIQDAVTSALRTAYEIRTHAEESAATLATEASVERDRIFLEIAKLDRERQTLAAAVRPAAPHAPARAEGRRTSSLRARADAAISGLIDKFVVEADAAARRPREAGLPGPAPAQGVPASRRAMTTPGPFTPRLVSAIDAEPRRLEDVSGAAAVERATAPQPTEELEIVVSGVPAFARLVELERRVQELPIVRTIHVRDYRHGVVRLAVGLRAASTAGEFAALVARIAQPRLTVLGSADATLELRLEGEVSVA